MNAAERNARDAAQRYWAKAERADDMATAKGYMEMAEAAERTATRARNDAERRRNNQVVMPYVQELRAVKVGQQS